MSKLDSLCTMVPVGDVPMKVCASDIINAGKAAWSIYKQSKPVVNPITDFGSALPCIKSQDGNTCLPIDKSWSLMENFKTAMFHGSTVKIETLTWPHIKQLSFDWSLQMTYGGNLIIDGKKKGQYIDQAQIVIRKIDAGKDNRVDITCSVVEIFNKGTVDNPIAGIHFQINIYIHNTGLYSDKWWTCNVYAYGDGTYTVGVCDNKRNVKIEKFTTSVPNRVGVL